MLEIPCRPKCNNNPNSRPRWGARIGAAAERAGLGSSYGGESPRLGILKDLKELRAVLLGRESRTRCPEPPEVWDASAYRQRNGRMITRFCPARKAVSHLEYA